MCNLARLEATLHLGAAWDARRVYAPRQRLCCSPPTHLAWRLFLAAYALSVSIVNRAAQSNVERYAAYLTVHGVWLTVAYFLSTALSAALARWRPALLRTPGHRLHAQATQLVFAIAVPFQLVIVTLYWLLLATPQATPFAAWDNLESHGVKFALLWADLCLGSSMVLPTPQVLVTLAAAAVYLAINLAVTLSSWPVYPVLQWNSGASAVLVLGASAYMVLAFFLAQCLARARDRLAKRLRGQGQGQGGGGGSSSTAALLVGDSEASSSEGCSLFPEEFSDDAQSCARLCDCSCSSSGGDSSTSTSTSGDSAGAAVPSTA